MAPRFDLLDFSKLGEDYAFLAPLVAFNPELRDVWVQASEGKLVGTQAIINAFKNTKWWGEHNQYARRAQAEYQLSKQGQSADWQLRLQQAGLLVDQLATSIGARLPENVRQDLIQQTIYQGYDQPGRQMLLQRAMSDQIQRATDGGMEGMLAGASGLFEDKLREVAQRNGIRYSDQWYVDAARSVANGRMTEDDWIRSVQDKAASLFPVFSDQIRAGATAYDLASPYINRMADELELNPLSIGLDDPYIMQALGGVDQGGKPTAMGLWDFTMKVRNDPRWMNTRYAQNQITGVADAVMQMFGLRG